MSFLLLGVLFWPPQVLLGKVALGGNANAVTKLTNQDILAKLAVEALDRSHFITSLGL